MFMLGNTGLENLKLYLQTFYISKLNLIKKVRNGDACIESNRISDDRC